MDGKESLPLEEHLGGRISYLGDLQFQEEKGEKGEKEEKEEAF